MGPLLRIRKDVVVLQQGGEIAQGVDGTIRVPASHLPEAQDVEVEHRLLRHVRASR